MDVVARSGGQRLHLLAQAVGNRDLRLASSDAGEHQVAAAGGPRRVLAASTPLRDLPDLAADQVDDGHVELPALQAGGVGDLGELLGGVPGGRVVVAANVGHAPHVEALGVHDVDLRRAGTQAVGGEGDLLAG